MKRLLIILLLLVLVVGSTLVWRSHESKVNFQVPQTTENPVDPPTPKLVTQDTVPVTTETPTAAPSTLSDSGTTLIDIQSSDYPSGTVYGEQFIPTTFWTWNVTYTCNDETITTKTAQGNYLTTGPNLQVDLMVVLSNNTSVKDAIPYHSVNVQKTGSGSYSVTETADVPFYFRISGNCDWHVVALDNGAPLYPLVTPTR